MNWNCLFQNIKFCLKISPSEFNSWLLIKEKSDNLGWKSNFFLSLCVCKFPFLFVLDDFEKGVLILYGYMTVQSYLQSAWALSQTLTLLPDLMLIWWLLVLPRFNSHLSGQILNGNWKKHSCILQITLSISPPFWRCRKT